MPRLLITPIVLLIVLVLAIFGYQSGSKMMLFGLAVLPVAALLMGRPDIVMVLAMGLYHTTIKIPVLPPSLDMTRVLTLFCAVTLFASLIISKTSAPDRSPARWLVLFYAAVILITMQVRGFGLRIMGSSQWGGGEAVAQLFYIGLFLVRNHLPLTSKQWVFAFCFMAAASAIPLLADLAFIYSGGKIYHQYYFLSYTTGSLATGLFSDTLGIAFRLQRAIIVVPCMMQMAFLARGLRWVRSIGFTVMVAAAGLLAGISGHRVAILYLFLMLYFYAVLRYPGRFLKITLGAAAATIVAITVISLAAPHMPQSFQRAVAFLPTIRTTEAVHRDASGTLEWRLQVWRIALMDLPKYFWIGKGLTIPQEEIAQFQTIQNYYLATGRRIDTILGTILMRDYHNGPLSLLLDLGIGGFIAAIGILIALPVEGVRNLRRRNWLDTRLRLLYLLIIAYLLAEIVIFIFAYGDVRTIMRFLFLGTIAQGILMTDVRAENARRREDSTASPAAKVPRFVIR